MSITKVLVACYKHDFWQAKACIASIRYWYPKIPIDLLKDEIKGDFDTSEMERSFEVGVFQMERNIFGWGLSKLEPLFMKDTGERYLIIDADTLFVGPVLEALTSSDNDFIISPQPQESPDSDWFRRTYYDYTKLKELDISFEFPSFTFNTGQFVACPGKISRESFKGLIDYSLVDGTPSLLRNDVFACADQGRLCYILPKNDIIGEIKLGKIDFMIWSGHKHKMDPLILI